MPSSLWDTAVAKFRSCDVSPDTPRFDVTYRWEAQKKVHNGSIFGRTSNLYVTDRCFVPRRVCKLKLLPALRGMPELLLPRDGPSSIHLLPGQYDVVLGAAQVFGVAARTSFASIIEQSGGLPMVNLGRGAAGPHIYYDAQNWPLVGPLLTHARAVIICIMAGRSSPNSASGAFSSQAFGSDQIVAYDKVHAMWNKGGDEKRRADILRRESLASAQKDYAELARRIRAGGSSSSSSGSKQKAPPPRVLFVWLSGCPMSGCTKLWQYPQYYVAGDSSGGTEHALSALQRAAPGSEIVDASYGHLPPSPPIPIDQCASCMPTKAPKSAVCNSVRARQDALSSGLLCGVNCASVRDPYYPDDAAHEYAAKVIREALKKKPPPDGGAGGLEGEDLYASPLAAEPSSEELTLKPIDLSQSSRLFFSHVHKASGTTFLHYLSGLEGVVSCSTPQGGNLILGDHTRASHWPSFEKWWWWSTQHAKITPASCTFATIEEPELGDVYHRMSRLAKNKPRGGGGGGGGGGVKALAPAEPPQMVAFFRHPFARCRSHWGYEQALCHRPTTVAGGYHSPYCHGWFLPRYGDVNNTATHRKFADSYCADKQTRSLSVANGIQDVRAFLLRDLAFFGLTEHFTESLCLFLHQAGRFRRDLCTCEPPQQQQQQQQSNHHHGRALLIERELHPPDPREEELQKLGSIGMPPLSLSDAELRARNPHDLAVYHMLLRVLKQRVRKLEAVVGASIWGCGRSSWRQKAGRG